MLESVVETVVLPPGCCLLLVASGALLLLRWRRLGRWVLAAGVVALWLLCTPWVGGLLLTSLQDAPALSLVDPPPAQAIVVLGAGSDAAAPEYGGPTVGPLALQRLRYAARVHRATGRPLLVSGGSIPRLDVTHAALMRDVLEHELGVPVRWLETRSEDTWENARESAAILRQAGIRRVYLVTHAWHMPRARRSFEVHGLEVVAAPTGFRELPGGVLSGLVPRWTALRDSALALHEWIGRLWYRLAR